MYVYIALFSKHTTPQTPTLYTHIHPLDVHHTAQFLHAVQQRVAQLHCLQVLCVAGIRSRRLNHAVDLVDLAVQPVRGNETRQLTAHTRTMNIRTNQRKNKGKCATHVSSASVPIPKARAMLAMVTLLYESRNCV